MKTIRRSSVRTDLHTRTVALDDIHVRSGGDGRTVEAYAAVFNRGAEIRDQDGHYNEQIAPTAFNRTLSQRGTDFRVFYNHGMTLHGTASERHSMPIGTPLEVRADSHGLLTVTRYNKTSLADDVLEAIRNGDIRGQSFTGRILRSEPARGPWRARNGQLTTVTRHEIGLIEYGPTPLPAYEDANIVGVRANALSDPLADLILSGLQDGADEDLDALARFLGRTAEHATRARDLITETIADLGDDPAGADAAHLARLEALATRLDADPAEKTGTSDPEPADVLTREQVRARLYKMGVLS